MSTEQRAPRILIVQTGTAGALVPAHGDYPDWFRRALGASEEQMPVLRTAPELGGEKLDREVLFRTKAKGVLVTGSPLSAAAKEGWMEELGEALLRAGQAGTPVLGVCFGHQLLGQSGGGEVARNPRGREIGTVQVQLTEAGRKDPLFSWAEASRIDVQATHAEAVLPPPKRATLLASNENCATQALRALIRSRAEQLRGEGLDPVGLEASVRETDGRRILRAFADQVWRA